MRAYPYPRLTGPVTARVTAVRLRGPGDAREQLDSRRYSVVEQVVALGKAERDDWQTARLALTATVPVREIETKGHWSDLAVVAVLTEGTTNARTVARLEPGAEGGRDWTGEIELDRDSHLDRASLAVHVVATVGGIAGRIIASTEQEWLIDVVSEAPLRDRQLDVNTVSFARGAEWLRSFRDAPWIVDTSGVGRNNEVLAQYQRRFKYILVDEYQDTNVAQYLWLRLIAQRPAASERPSSRPAPRQGRRKQRCSTASSRILGRFAPRRPE